MCAESDGWPSSEGRSTPTGGRGKRVKDIKRSQSARMGIEKMFRGETRQAKLPMAMDKQESPKREDIAHTLSHKSSEGSSENNEEGAGDSLGGICGCRSPGHLDANSPK